MLNDATCFQNVYIVCGYTDLRSGIDKLASIIERQAGKSSFVPDTLYLFRDRKTDRIKGLVWEKDGFLLLCKRLEQGCIAKKHIMCYDTYIAMRGGMGIWI